MGMKEDFDRIETLLARWIADIETHNAVDYYDINKYGEDIALLLLNEIYSFNLINLNSINKHYPAADLGNPGTGFAFQVTSRRCRWVSMAMQRTVWSRRRGGVPLKTWKRAVSGQRRD